MVLGDGHSLINISHCQWVIARSIDRGGADLLKVGGHFTLGKVKYLKVAKPKMKSKNCTLVSRLLDSFSCKNHHAQKKVRHSC